MGSRPPGFRTVQHHRCELLKVHVTYGPLVQVLLKKFNRPGGPAPIRALAHITGGGSSDNIPGRFRNGATWKSGWVRGTCSDLPNHRGAQRGPGSEMYQVFNMGIGMTVTVSNAADAVPPPFTKARHSRLDHRRGRPRFRPVPRPLTCTNNKPGGTPPGLFALVMNLPTRTGSLTISPRTPGWLWVEAGQVGRRMIDGHTGGPNTDHVFCHQSGSVILHYRQPPSDAATVGIPNPRARSLPVPAEPCPGFRGPGANPDRRRSGTRLHRGHHGCTPPGGQEFAAEVFRQQASRFCPGRRPAGHTGG